MLVRLLPQRQDRQLSSPAPRHAPLDRQSDTQPAGPVQHNQLSPRRTPNLAGAPESHRFVLQLSGPARVDPRQQTHTPPSSTPHHANENQPPSQPSAAPSLRPPEPARVDPRQQTHTPPSLTPHHANENHRSAQSLAALDQTTPNPSIL